MHKDAGQVFNFDRAIACNFNILKTFVIEMRHKCLNSVTFQNINISLERIAVVGRTIMHINVRLVRPAVFIQHLAMFQAHSSSFFTFQANAADS